MYRLLLFQITNRRTEYVQVHVFRSQTEELSMYRLHDFRSQIEELSMYRCTFSDHKQKN